jgi:DNA-binding MarR family transcriptional regulator
MLAGRLHFLKLALYETPDCGHELVGAFCPLVFRAAGDAVANVVVDELERDCVDRFANRADLGEDVDAVTVVLDHARDPAHLALHARESFQQLGPALGVSGHGRSVYRGWVSSVTLNAVVAGSDITVLAVLARAEAHGRELMGRLARGEIDSAALYGSLDRLERAGYVRSWVDTHGVGRRRVYALTGRGRRSLAEQQSLWRVLIRSFQRLASA